MNTLKINGSNDPSIWNRGSLKKDPRSEGREIEKRLFSDNPGVGSREASDLHLKTEDHEVAKRLLSNKLGPDGARKSEDLYPPLKPIKKGRALAIILGVLGVGGLASIATYFGIHHGMTWEVGSAVLTTAVAVTAVVASVLLLAKNFENKKMKALAIIPLALAALAFVALSYISVTNIHLTDKIQQGFKQLHDVKDELLVAAMAATPLLIGGIAAAYMIRKKEEAEWQKQFDSFKSKSISI